MGKTQTDKILFNAGKATLTFRDLAAGQPGTVTLDISEGATVKFRGSRDNVTLVSGQANILSISLSKVDGGVKVHNASRAVDAGATVLISASGIFQAADPAENARVLRAIANGEAA